MKWWLVVIMLLVMCGGIAFFLRKRSRKRKLIHKSGEKHPTGFLKYHEKTETRLKKALEFSKATGENTKAVAVIQFKGDLRASANRELSHLIDEVILNEAKISELVIKVDSPGGSVMEYGHSFALIERVRKLENLKLTVCVDNIAASGGYLMSLAAHQIIAAPFAMVGSIGVVSFVPNIRKLLEKYNIQPRTFTAGSYKRMVTLTDEANPEQVECYQKHLELIHDQFKQVIGKYRPQTELPRAATGEAWLAQNSVDLKLGLVDRIMSSSEYLLEKNKHQDLIFFSEKPQRSWFSRVTTQAARLVLESIIPA